MNLASLVKRTALKCPSHTAIAEGREQVSYADLWQHVESLSKAFRSIGIEKNDRAVILLPNCREFIYSLLALLNINAVAVPLKPQTTAWELGGILEDCAPKALILTPHLLNNILTRAPGLLEKCMIIVTESEDQEGIMDQDGHLDKSPVYSLGTLLEMGRQMDLQGTGPQTRPDQVATINYTYRGYGYPLGAMLTHANYVHGALNYIRHRKSSGSETVLLALPSAHILPLVGCIMVPLLVGAKIVVIENRSPKHIFQAIASNRVNILVLVPLVFAVLARTYSQDLHDISSLKYGITGGSYMPAKLHGLIKEKMNLEVIQGYGLTECLPVTCNYLSTNKPETLGPPLHGVRIKVVDQRGRDCGIGRKGEILIKSPQIMAGYYRNQKDTCTVMKDGWLASGDYGWIDREGHLHFEGLKKKIANIGGNKVDLIEVRDRLLSQDHIMDVILETFQDNLGGEKLRALVKLKNGVNGPASDGMNESLKDRLSPHKIPSEFVISRPD